MWDDHDQWIEQLRQFLGEEASNLEDDDLIFVSNLAAQAMHGEISLPQVLEEIHKWGLAKLGVIPSMSEEAFELELSVNYPELIEVTEGVKANLIYADEPGIADGLIRVFADPRFTEFVPEGSMVAMQGKAWFEVLKLNPAEHATLGWAIYRAVQDASQ
jgi:hypothetical protein